MTVMTIERLSKQPVKCIDCVDALEFIEARRHEYYPVPLHVLVPARKHIIDHMRDEADDDQR